MNVVAEGAASPVITPPALGLSIWEPLMGNWSRVKYLLEGWRLPQNWRRVETPEATGLDLHELENCLDILGGHVAPGIVGSFIEVVENVIEREMIRERVSEERVRCRWDRDTL